MGCPADIRRADGLVGILYLLSALLPVHTACRIFTSIVLHNIFFCSPGRLFRYPGGIGTQIGNDPHSPAAFYINPFVKLLCQTHGFLCGKIQRFAGLLLQCGRSKRQRRFLNPLSLLHFIHMITLLIQLPENLFQLLSRCNRLFSVLCAVIFGRERFLFSFYGEFHIQTPIFFRDKSADFLFPVADNTQCH